ncbi:MAG: hypothetical protein JO105_01650 [Hyphomicrobiales bacterium]|nr:hypothetical protein [Hyphomicrobiales bacterium]
MVIGEGRALLQRHLAQAQKDVALGTRHVERQLEILAELGRDGHPTAQAEELLRTFEECLRLHIQGRDRLEKELAEE